MGTLDYDDDCGEDECPEDDATGMPSLQSAEEIISILKGM